MAQAITQCPQCRTSFNLNDAQLHAADGFARCGACLKVFKASENLVNLRDAEEDTSITQKVDFERLPEPGDLALPELHDQENIQESHYLGQTSAAPMQPEALIEDPSFQVLEDQTTTDDKPGLVADDNPELQADGENLPFQFQAHYSEYPDQSEHPSPADPEPDYPFLGNFRDDDALEPASEEELSAINHTPVEIETTQPPGRLKIFALLAVNGLLALTLGAQLLWFNRDTLARDERFRPWLEQTCQLIACELPESVNLGAFVAEELSIRSHPSAEEALEVNFIFRNTAAFPQDFPLVELSFSDIGNRLLANRHFSPDEYLPGALQNLGQMPPGTPVQITLEIIDPGDQAVNYTMAFRRPPAN